MQKLIMIAALAATPLSCLATVTYTSQDRYVSAATGFPDSVAAQDFQEFNASAHAYHPAYYPDLLQLAEASQTSSIGQHGITASGLISANTGGYAYSSLAASVCDITFTIDTPMSYALTGTWTHGYGHTGVPGQYDGRTVFIDFSGPGVHERTTYSRPDYFIFPTTYEINAGGVLQPGEYRLNIFFSWHNSRIGSSFPYSSDPGDPMTYDVTLALAEIPAPGTIAVFMPAIGLITRRKR